MQKSVCLFILFVTCFFMLSFSAGAVDISAKGAVLLEIDSGDVVFGKNEHAPLPMASTTKIMTALVVLENARLSDTVAIEPNMVGIEGSSIYLRVGEVLTVEDLLYALLLESANDASVALAIHTSGSVEAFADMMNQKACELGLKSTNFTNPHGLDDTNHYTTAHDLAIIASNAMQNEDFARIVSTKKSVIPLSNGEGSRVLVNHNRLLRTYNGAIGIKTGYTKRCGRCLVSSAERNGVRLICVTLNAPNDWNDHKALLDYGFTQYESINLATPGCYTVELCTIGGNKSTFIASNDQALTVTLKKGAHDFYAILEANRLISAPVHENEAVGTIAFYDGNTLLGRLPLLAKDTVEKLNYKKSLFERIFG